MGAYKIKLQPAYTVGLHQGFKKKTARLLGENINFTEGRYSTRHVNGTSVTSLKSILGLPFCIALLLNWPTCQL